MKTQLSLAEAYIFGKTCIALPPIRISSDTLKKITTNLARINKVFPDTNKATAEIFVQHGKPQEGSAEFGGFIKAKSDYERNTKFEVELETIKFEDLRIGIEPNENQLTPSVIGAFRFMIEDLGQ